MQSEQWNVVVKWLFVFLGYLDFSQSWGVVKQVTKVKKKCFPLSSLVWKSSVYYQKFFKKIGFVNITVCAQNLLRVIISAFPASTRTPHFHPRHPPVPLWAPTLHPHSPLSCYQPGRQVSLHSVEKGLFCFGNLKQEGILTLPPLFCGSILEEYLEYGAELIMWCELNCWDRHLFKV